MALYNFHRVLISAAVLFDFFFTLWCVRMWRRTGDTMTLVMGIGSTTVVVILIAYLIYFNRSLSVLRERDVIDAGRTPGNARSDATG